jgi:glycine dehydrogenase subunit 2
LETGGKLTLDYDRPSSIGKVRSFYGNFLVALRALSYILTLGADGLADASKAAVLNANYMLSLLKTTFDTPVRGSCMHEFVLSLQTLKTKPAFRRWTLPKRSLIIICIRPPCIFRSSSMRRL